MTPERMQQLPRLADYAELDPESLPDPHVMSHAERTWFCTAGVLPTGWCLTPPTRLAADGPWIAIAYNLEGCLFDGSYVVGTDLDPHGAVIQAGGTIVTLQDGGLLRERTRRPN